jgi:hypothetical protein
MPYSQTLTLPCLLDLIATQLISPSNVTSFLPLRLRLSLLQYLLDDLLLLDQKGPHDSVPHAIPTSRSAVGASHGLLGV